MSRRIHVKSGQSVLCQVRSVSFHVKSDPYQAASVSCRVKSAPCPSSAGRVVPDLGVSACPCHVGATLHKSRMRRSRLSRAPPSPGIGNRLLRSTDLQCARHAEPVRWLSSMCEQSKAYVPGALLCSMPTWCGFCQIPSWNHSQHLCAEALNIPTLTTAQSHLLSQLP